MPREWNMDSLWTWGGEDFGFRSGDDLRTHDGRHVGRFHCDEVFAADGRYLGEVRGDRLITRRSRMGATCSPFNPKGKCIARVRHVSLAGNIMISGYEDFPAPGDL
jgi:hypothetical protein